MQEKGDKKAPYEKVLADIRQRDDRDMHRAVAPLKCAPDAVKVDTSDLTLEESAAALLAVIEKRLGL